ncbi:MAG: Rho termination factor N-terminal domain-containing protein, partial [Pseudomonadota bacterium]
MATTARGAQNGNGGGPAKKRNSTRKKSRRGKRNNQSGINSDHLPPDEENFEIIPPEQLELSKSAMNLTELKKRPASALVELAESMGLENMARSRKQDIIFAVLKAHARNGEDIYGDGVLEILQDGFGFLRSADSSYMAGPDDIYVSP